MNPIRILKSQFLLLVWKTFSFISLVSSVIKISRDASVTEDSPANYLLWGLSDFIVGGNSLI